MEKKKVVLKLEAHDEKAWQKAMKTVTSFRGIESATKDQKEKKLTVIGDVDPVVVVKKLRKLFRTEIVTIGPAKEPEKKKDEPKKEEPKKDDPKPRERLRTAIYEAGIPAEHVNIRGGRSANFPTEHVNIRDGRSANIPNRSADNPSFAQYYQVNSIEENPNACVIC